MKTIEQHDLEMMFKNHVVEVDDRLAVVVAENGVPTMHELVIFTKEDGSKVYFIYKHTVAFDRDVTSAFHSAMLLTQDSAVTSPNNVKFILLDDEAEAKSYLDSLVRYSFTV